MTKNYNKGVEDDLQVLSSAVHYKNWLWSKVEPFVGNRVLETGSGIGNYSEYLLFKEFVILSDYDYRYVELLKNRYAEHDNVRVVHFDISKIDYQRVEEFAAKRIDTILCLNVLEHVEEDEVSICRMSACLSENGRIILVVPANRFLYSALDREYEHVRRYVKHDAGRLAKASGLHPVHVSHFNFIGFWGWLLSHKILKKRRLSLRQALFFDRMVPLIRRMDVIGFCRIGLSLLIVLENS